MVLEILKMKHTKRIIVVVTIAVKKEEEEENKWEVLGKEEVEMCNNWFISTML